MNALVRGKGRGHSRERKSLGGRLRKHGVFRGYISLVSPLVCFSTHFSQQAHLHPLLQLPETLTKPLFSSSSLLLVIFEFQTPRPNILQNFSIECSESSHPKLHSSSPFLVPPFGSSGQRLIGHPRTPHPVSSQLTLMQAARMPQFGPHKSLHEDTAWVLAFIISH